MPPKRPRRVFPALCTGPAGASFLARLATKPSRVANCWSGPEFVATKIRNAFTMSKRFGASVMRFRSAAISSLDQRRTWGTGLGNCGTFSLLPSRMRDHAAA